MKDLIQNARAVEARLRSKKVWLGDKQMDQIADTISSLCTALDAAQKDAERYRWMREDQATTWNEPWCVTRRGSEDIEPYALFMEELDQAIDAAIKAQGETK